MGLDILSKESEFLIELEKNIEIKDLLLLVLVPILLIIIFLLPQDFQEAMVLNFDNPQFSNFFTTVFVHLNLDHLTNNLISYGVTIIPLYLMCVLSGFKRQFRYLFLTFVFLFPFLLSGLNLILLDIQTTRGFSGVNSAFIGYLGVGSFQYLKQSLGVQNKEVHFDILKIFHGAITSKSIILFLYGSAIMALFYTGPTLIFITILIFIAIYLSALIYTTNWQPLKKSIQRTEYFGLFIFSILIFLISVPSLFPIEIGGVNIISHYLGLLLGFFTAYLCTSICEKPG